MKLLDNLKLIFNKNEQKNNPIIEEKTENFDDFNENFEENENYQDISEDEYDDNDEEE